MHIQNIAYYFIQERKKRRENLAFHSLEICYIFCEKAKLRTFIKKIPRIRKHSRMDQLISLMEKKNETLK